MILARAPIFFFWVKPYSGGALDLVFFFLLVHELGGGGAALSISLVDF